VTSSSCKERALGNNTRFFEVSIFLYVDDDDGLLPAARARVRPCYLELTRGCFNFQMDLTTKFKMVSSCQQTEITSLKTDTPYPIERAESVFTKYGEAILMTTSRIPPDIRESVFTSALWDSLW